MGALLPELYLHGLAEGDFEPAIRELLGEKAPLSKATLRRLREGWTQDFEAWGRRSLKDREVVYTWADGSYVKAGLALRSGGSWGRPGSRRCHSGCGHHSPSGGDRGRDHLPTRGPLVGCAARRRVVRSPQRTTTRTPSARILSARRSAPRDQ